MDEITREIPNLIVKDGIYDFYNQKTGTKLNLEKHDEKRNKKFFNLLKQEYDSDITHYWAEKNFDRNIETKCPESGKSSIIMIDLDIKQLSQKSGLKELIYVKNNVYYTKIDFDTFLENDKVLSEPIMIIDAYVKEVIRLFYKYFKLSNVQENNNTPFNGESSNENKIISLSHDTLITDVRIKPCPILYDDANKDIVLYKDGFQMFIHARMTQGQKQFFIDQINKEKIHDRVFLHQIFTSTAMHKPSSYLDKNSATVDTMLLGGVKRPKNDYANTPKKLFRIFKSIYQNDNNPEFCIKNIVIKYVFYNSIDDIVNSKSVDSLPLIDFDNGRFNQVRELSSNYDGALILKRDITTKSKYENEVDAFEKKILKKNVTNKTLLHIFTEKSHTNKILYEYVNSLPYNCFKYSNRFVLACALINYDSQNKTDNSGVSSLILLADAMYNHRHGKDAKADDKFQMAIKNAESSLAESDRYKDVGFNTIKGWVFKQNRTKYNEIDENSLYSLIDKFLYTDNKLTDEDYASMIRVVIGVNKFKTVCHSKRNAKDNYLFIDDQTKVFMDDKEYDFNIKDKYDYKWFNVNDAMLLPVFDPVIEHIRNTASIYITGLIDATTYKKDSIIKNNPNIKITKGGASSVKKNKDTINDGVDYSEKLDSINTVINNEKLLRTRLSQFNDMGFLSIMKNAVNKYLHHTVNTEFANKLNESEMCFGIRGGILELDPKGFKSRVIEEYNGKNITFSCDLKFIPIERVEQFNDPNIHEVLLFFKSTFMDNEFEKFMFTMFCFASCLNRKERQFLLHFLGGGANGKSFKLKLLNLMFGTDYCLSTTGAVFVAASDNPANASPQLFDMLTKSITIAEEIPNKDSRGNKVEINSKTLKDLTSGTEMTARPLYGDPTYKMNKSFLILATNSAVAFQEYSYAMLRRYKAVICNITFKPDNEYENYCQNGVKIARIKRRSPIYTEAWAKDEKTRTACLSILEFFHRWFAHEYNCSFDKVPHSQIETDTKNFFNAHNPFIKYIECRIRRVNKTIYRNTNEIKTMLNQSVNIINNPIGPSNNNENQESDFDMPGPQENEVITVNCIFDDFTNWLKNSGINGRHIDFREFINMLEESALINDIEKKGDTVTRDCIVENYVFITDQTRPTIGNDNLYSSKKEPSVTDAQFLDKCRQMVNTLNSKILQKKTYTSESPYAPNKHDINIQDYYGTIEQERCVDESVENIFD